MNLLQLTLDGASFQFVTFGLLVAILSNVRRTPGWRSGVLLLASLFFVLLLARDAMFLAPLVAFLLLGYGGLRTIERGVIHGVVICVVIVVSAYVYLKKYTFLPSDIFIRFPYLTLGLSYIFFRVLHLLIETVGRRERLPVGLGAYLLYTLNFTTLVSGPIQRFDDFARDQFAIEPCELGPRVIGSQLERIIRGLFKVNVLAVFLFSAHEDALSIIAQPASTEVKLLAFLELAASYPFFLYANFSGYIDIVIGLARLMRLRLPENFDRPFSSTSFLDFWSRWHITLSSWFKSYVYNPLLVASMRRISTVSLQPLLGVVCFFITFFLVGIWHGRSSEFVMYGLLQGGGISINKLWQLRLASALGRKGYQSLAKHPMYSAFARGLTFSWFAFTLFWLWADWRQIYLIFAALKLAEWVALFGLLWLVSTVVLALWEWMRSALLSLKVGGGPMVLSRYARVIYASAFALIVCIMTILLSQPAPGIVYKGF